jgi:hypothetical protein
MQNLPASFTFNENILIRCFICFFFGLAALVIAVAAALKLGDGPDWIILFLAAVLLALFLFYFIFVSIRYRQVITVTSQNLTSVSPALGTTQIPWRDITDIREVQTRIERARSAAPLVEVMLSLYFNLPFLAGIERRGLLVFEAGDKSRIEIRQHLIYPHRLDQLRQAIERYAPSRRQGEQYLKLNLNN